MTHTPGADKHTTPYTSPATAPTEHSSHPQPPISERTQALPAPALPDAVDTLVIGGGTGGATLTAVLSALSEQTVLLVEAGPDYGPAQDGNWPADVLDARSIPLSHDYAIAQPATSGKGILDLPRARVLGGCSSHNGCTASIGAAQDYDEWAALGNPGWDAHSVLPLLEWVRDRFRVRRYSVDELTEPQRAFVAAGTAVGLPFADDLDDIGAAEGIGPMPVNIVDGYRYNAAFAFLDAVRDHANLTIAGSTALERIEVQDGRATGAWLMQGEDRHYVRAERIVLAAGAYHSPALLLRSGIGPAEELEGLGVDVVAHAPGVGKHLLDHSCVQLDFHGRSGLVEDLAALSWNPDEQTVGRQRSSRCDEGPYDLHVFMVAGANSGHPGLPPITLYGGAMRARSEGTVTLPADLDASRPVVHHRYGTDPEGYDRQVLSEALDLLRSMTAVPELAAVLGEPAPREHDPLDNIVNYCHPAGSCKMGPASDPMAVVDARGAVHAVEGLFVADASIMPAITRGNINLPTAMIGAKVALGLLGRSPADIIAALPLTEPATASILETSK
ncbi:GMC family oxidoreductase [Streptomyces sp. NP160]|uniref:GMC family oxidoreductase n=1 Tax=Streptomyces sp. NP160 TaxID=2586637 RepID=UPI0011196997|nr:GMC family oxidoreductase [Streptomyces sp. NP160]TNM63158.1 GMC family oxidoreductase [Streptomyces sp. NP160]